MSPSDAGSHRLILAAGLAVAVGAVVFVMADQPVQRAPHSPAHLVVVALTGVIAVGGLALSAAIRLLSGRPATLDVWSRRAVVAALLLMPAAFLLTGTYTAAGWDFDTCGTLLSPNRPAGADLVGFRSQCDVAASGRLDRVLIWVAVVGMVSVAYGVLLRRRARVVPPAVPVAG